MLERSLVIVAVVVAVEAAVSELRLVVAVVVAVAAALVVDELFVSSLLVLWRHVPHSKWHALVVLLPKLVA